ncbi:MAG: transposase [Nitrososphaeraceae archaeon]
MPIIPKDQLKALIKEYNLKDPKDIQEMLKKLFGDTLQEILEAELDHELGYSKYDYKNKATDNSRNGHSSKTVKSNYGKVDLSIAKIFHKL